MKALTGGLTIVVLALAAPGAHAATTVGIAVASGAAAGEAVEVRGDSRANDITISLARVRAANLITRRFTIVDRRGRVRVHKTGGQWGCRVRSTHKVVCSKAPTSYAYVFLGAGDDRLKVQARGDAPAQPALRPAPDVLDGIPQDEGGDGAFLGWRIEGGPGRDRISGSPDFDHIVGGPGSDVLDGRRGADRFDQGGEPGTDTIRGGSGYDALLWTATTPLNVDLRAGRFTGGTVASIEQVRGGAGNDTLIGSDAPELLQGAGGADAIAGLGGADLLVGDGLYLSPAAADAIDAGPGDDLVDISNRAYNPYGPSVDRVDPGPPDSLSCGEGNDRIDTFSSQLVPADCEGARFLDAATTVPLRPLARTAGALVYDVPCPTTNYTGSLTGVCNGTLTLTRSTDGLLLGSAPFSVRGGSRAAITIQLVQPVPGREPVAASIKGTFGGAPGSNRVFEQQSGIGRFDFGWALGL